MFRLSFPYSCLKWRKFSLSTFSVQDKVSHEKTLNYLKSVTTQSDYPLLFMGGQLWAFVSEKCGTNRWTCVVEVSSETLSDCKKY